MIDITIRWKEEDGNKWEINNSNLSEEKLEKLLDVLQIKSDYEELKSSGYNHSFIERGRAGDVTSIHCNKIKKADASHNEKYKDYCDKCIYKCNEEICNQCTQSHSYEMPSKWKHIDTLVKKSYEE